MRNIKKYRGLVGLNQQELAKKLGLSRQTICFFESERCKFIEEEKLEKMAELFNCQVTDLYGLDNLKYMPENDTQCMKLISLLFSLLTSDESRVKIIKELEDNFYSATYTKEDSDEEDSPKEEDWENWEKNGIN